MASAGQSDRVVFRRVRGRIVPIKVNAPAPYVETTDVLRGAGALMVGFGAGNLARKAKENFQESRSSSFLLTTTYANTAERQRRLGSTAAAKYLIGRGFKRKAAALLGAGLLADVGIDIYRNRDKSASDITKSAAGSFALSTGLTYLGAAKGFAPKVSTARALRFARFKSTTALKTAAKIVKTVF